MIDYAVKKRNTDAALTLDLPVLSLEEMRNGAEYILVNGMRKMEEILREETYKHNNLRTDIAKLQMDAFKAVIKFAEYVQKREESIKEKPLEINYGELAIGNQ